MRYALVLAAALGMSATSAAAEDAPRTALVIHGGAGTMQRADLTPELEAQIRAALDAALDAGDKVLQAGGGRSTR